MRSLSIIPAVLIIAALVLSVTGHSHAQGNETDGGTSGGCCAIASAYDATDHDDLDKIREFRDDYLMTDLVGRSIVALYYNVLSPPVAKFINDHPSVKPLARAALTPVIAVSTVAVDTTPAEKAVIAGLLVLVSVVFIPWFKRRHRGGVQPS